MANYDRQDFERDLLLCSCPSIHCSIAQIWRQTPLIKDVLNPASYTVDLSLSGVQAHAILRLHTRVLRNLQIAHMCYAISRLCTRITQSRDCQRNLGILRMRNAISRLRKFSDCAEKNIPLACGSGYIYCKLPLTSVSGSIFAIYTSLPWFIYNIYNSQEYI